MFASLVSRVEVSATTDGTRRSAGNNFEKSGPLRLDLSAAHLAYRYCPVGIFQKRSRRRDRSSERDREGAPDRAEHGHGKCSAGDVDSARYYRFSEAF
jgi:hypothetical protein